MLLEPVSSEVLIFPHEWLDAGLYEGPVPIVDGPAGLLRIAAIDFAFTEKRLKDNPDYSVCLIGDRRPDGHLFASGIFRARLTYPEFRDRAITWMKEAGVRYVYAEGNGPQMGLVQDFDRHAPFPVIGVPRAIDKVTRAAEVQPFVMSGRYHLPGVRANGRLHVRADFQEHYDEVTTFPAGDHDDTVDTMVDLINAAATLGWSERVEPPDPTKRRRDYRDPRSIYQ
jgi:predicted phage terminase large subunit-like protein